MSNAVIASLCIAFAATLLLHWRNSGMRPPIYLPTAAFVPEMPVSRGRQKKIVRRALLALRGLLLTALLLAAWQFLPKEAPAQKADGHAVAIVIDVSASMAQTTGTQSAMDALRARVHGELARAKQQDLAVGLFVGQAGNAAADVPFTSDHAAIEAALGALTPAGPTALVDALERAASLCARHGHVERGLVLTDGAAHAWPQPLPQTLSRPVPFAVESVVKPGAQNDAVTQVHLTRAGDDAFDAEIHLMRHGGTGGERRLRLQWDAHTIERTSVRLTPGEGLVHRTRLSVPDGAMGGAAPSLFQARLESDGIDALPSDDERAQWVMPRASTRMVALCDVGRETEDPATYVAHALSHAIDGQRPIASQSVASPSAALRAQAPLLFIADVGAALQEEPVKATDAIVTAARMAVLQSLGDAARAPRLGAAPPPLVFGQLRDAREPSEAPPAGRRLGSVDWRHPLLAALEPLVRTSLLQARVYRYWQISDVPRDAQVLMRLDDGSPLLLAHEAGNKHHRRLLFTSTLSPQWTDLPLRSGFVPLVHRMAAWLEGGELHTPQVATERVPFVFREGGAATVAARLTAPTGATKQLAGGAASSEEMWALEERGRWRAERLVDGQWQAWVDYDVWVEAPHEESDLTASEGALWPATSSAAAALPLATPASGIYRWLLLAALLLALDSVSAPTSSPKKAARVGVVP